MPNTDDCTCTDSDHCACFWSGVQSGIVSAHASVSGRASADENHPSNCECAPCRTITNVAVAFAFEAAWDMFVHFPHPGTMTPADWRAWGTPVARECANAVVPLFHIGARAVAITESGTLGLRVAQNVSESIRQGASVGVRQVLKDVTAIEERRIAEMVSAAIQRSQ